MYSPRLLPFLLAQLPICIVGFGFENSGASCSSNEYCPGGWSVLRRLNDYSAHTCNPADPARAKCPKPHMCVAAKCGISFCCASDKMLDKLREQQSAERDVREAEEEEREEADRTESGVIDEGTEKDEQKQRKRASDVDL